MTASAVLLVEDDDVFSEEFSAFLEAFGFHATRCRTLDDGLRALASNRFDAVLLDQFVHGRDALTVLPAVRRVYDGPVIVITNNPEVADRVVGLESGADDFVQKLAGPREILARIRSVMRRRFAAMEPPAAEAGGPAQPVSQSLPWRAAFLGRQVFAPDGTPLELTASEFDLLVYLAGRRGELVTRDDVLRAYGGPRPARRRSRAADGMISRLRTILAAHLNGTSAIKSVRGRGYVFIGFDLVPIDGR